MRLNTFKKSAFYALSGLSLALMVGCSATNKVQDHQLSSASVAQLLEQGAVPGISVAVIDDGALVFSDAQGFKDVSGGQKVDRQTVFEAASLSKVVAAYMTLQLVDKGVLDLDKPLHQYLPDGGKKLTWLEGFIDHEQNHQITARMVLSHTSGLPNWRGRRALKPMFEPGARYSYSSEGFLLLQRVLEQVSGLPLEALAKQQVFEPLQMSRSSFDWRQDYEQNYAKPHDVFLSPLAKNKNITINAAASLHTTAQDFARFLQAMMQGQGLAENQVKQMLMTQVDASAYFRQPPGSLAWGLGVGINQTETREFYWHTGNNRNFRAIFVVDKAENDAVVVLTNSNNGQEIFERLTELSIGGNPAFFKASRIADYQTPYHRVKALLATQSIDEVLKTLSQSGLLQALSNKDAAKLSQLLARHGLQDKAKRLTAAVFKTRNDDGEAGFNAAVAALRDADIDAAKATLKQVVKITPEHQKAQNLLSSLSQDPNAVKGQWFRLKGFDNAKLVTLAGTFNGWDPLARVMVRQNGQWVAKVALDAGEHQYKFVVDGRWMLDPDNELKAQSGGQVNSAIRVE